MPWTIKIGQELTVEMAARDQQLNVWINGELAIAYRMPMARQNGKFGLWTHAGSAEFLEVLIDPLPKEFHLASVATEKTRWPLDGESPDDVQAVIAKLKAEFPLWEKQVEIARAEQVALHQRSVAEQGKLTLPRRTQRTPLGVRRGKVSFRSCFRR